MSSDYQTIGLLNYYCRNKLYQHVVDAARQSSDSAACIYFGGFAELMLNNINSAIDFFEQLKAKDDWHLCAYLALKTAFKLCKTFDKQQYSDIDQKLKDEHRTASDAALYAAALFLFHCEKYDKSKEFAERALKRNSNNKEAISLRGWCDLMTSGGVGLGKALLETFDAAITAGNGMKFPDAMFGKAKYFEMKKSYAQSLDVLNQTIVAFPAFLPALIEKMRVQLFMSDWEACVETAERCLMEETACIEAIKYKALKAICYDGDYRGEGIAMLSELNSAMLRTEG